MDCIVCRALLKCSYVYLNSTLFYQKYQTKSFIRKYKGIFRLKVIRKLFKTNNFIVAYTSEKTVI